MHIYMIPIKNYILKNVNLHKYPQSRKGFQETINVSKPFSRNRKKDLKEMYLNGKSLNFRHDCSHLYAIYYQRQIVRKQYEKHVKYTLNQTKTDNCSIRSKLARIKRLWQTLRMAIKTAPISQLNVFYSCQQKL